MRTGKTLNKKQSGYGLYNSRYHAGKFWLKEFPCIHVLLWAVQVDKKEVKRNGYLAAEMENKEGGS